MGWAQTLARPGGMVTGLFFIGVVGKRFRLLKEVQPQATTFGYLINANNPANPQLRKTADDGARALGLKLEIVEVKELAELPDAIGRVASLGVGGLVITPDPVFNSKAVGIVGAQLQSRHGSQRRQSVRRTRARKPSTVS